MPSPYDTMLGAAVEMPVATEGLLQAPGYRSMTATACHNNNNVRKSLPLSSSYPPPNLILTPASHLTDGKTFFDTTTTTTPAHHRPSKLHPKIVWRNVDAVCFDVDSTVCRDEAIDELAEFCGCGERVAEMTRVAMNGNMTFRQALTTRLNIIRPSVNDVNNFLHANPPRLTEGIAELVEALHDRRIPVYLVTGGFRRIVEPVARLLRIPPSNIFANDLLFDPENGDYAGFDHEQPTSDSGGKTLVCSSLKRKFGYKRLVMVGDGATDAETSSPPPDPKFRPGADAFVGFGGNVARPGVVAQAEWFVYDFAELLDALPPLRKE